MLALSSAAVTWTFFAAFMELALFVVPDAQPYKTTINPSNKQCHGRPRHELVFPVMKRSVITWLENPPRHKRPCQHKDWHGHPRKMGLGDQSFGHFALNDVMDKTARPFDERQLVGKDALEKNAHAKMTGHVGRHNQGRVFG